MDRVWTEWRLCPVKGYMKPSQFFNYCVLTCLCWVLCICCGRTRDSVLFVCDLMCVCVCDLVRVYVCVCVCVAFQGIVLFVHTPT